MQAAHRADSTLKRLLRASAQRPSESMRLYEQKTGIVELAILRLFRNPTTTPRPKAVYLAPLRALCDERWREWQSLFSPLQLRVALVTGDTPDTEPARNSMFHADVIVTTPEKWYHTFSPHTLSRLAVTQPALLTASMLAVCATGTASRGAETQREGCWSS